MGISLLRLLDETRHQFSLEVLAGHKGLENEVSRIYSLEDIDISSWTRKGELVLTTGVILQDEQALLNLIDALLPYEPSGLIINMGGYIFNISPRVIAHCNEVGLPLVTFPWEIFLQGVIQNFTNRIFEEEQKAHNVARAFLSALFSPDQPALYRPLLERNVYQYINSFVVVSLFLDQMASSTKSDFIFRKLKESGEKIIGIFEENDQILVFCDVPPSRIYQLLQDAAQAYALRFPQSPCYFGMGDESDSFTNLHSSYDKALKSRNYGRYQNLPLVSIQELGVIGLLLTSDRKLMYQYYRSILGLIIDFDAHNNTQYLITLESFIKNGGNIQMVSKDLFIHRNTVNYRMNKIRELIGHEISSMSDFVNYQIAFYIKQLI